MNYVMCASPNQPHTQHEACPRTMEADKNYLVKHLRTYGNMANRVIVYCRSLDMCTRHG